MMELTVVWDGTLNREGGRMLFAPEGAVRQATSIRERPWGEHTRRLRALIPVMGDRWYSVPEMASLLGDITTDSLRSAVGQLVVNGHMVREHPEHSGGRWAGEVQRYRWKV